jgi:alkanesulfonate monooxygenase SsuD/methylene tetrahydromethanopterin reductase-like flavin-dependent oxidoreductase (luciferase family)
MQVGIALPNQVAPGGSLADAVRISLSATRAARSMGYDGILAGQHHLSSPYPYCSPIPLLARLAGEAGSMDLVAMDLLTLHNPVAVAEELATLAAGCEGRVVVAAALGYRDVEFQAFGIDPSRRVARLTEALELLEQLLHDDTAEYHGAYFDLPSSPNCTRTGPERAPAVWIAASAEAGIRRAARWGYPWLIEPASRLDSLVIQRRAYEEALDTSSALPPSEVPIIREVFVDTQSRRARELAGAALVARYATYQQWGHEKDFATGERFDASFDELAEGRFIVGSPNECLERIQELGELLGATWLFLHSHWPGFPLEETLRSMRLFAEHVRPGL